MAEQHIKFLQGLGVPQDQIEILEKVEADKAKDYDATELVNLVKGNYKTSFLNDADFLNGIPEEKIPEETRKKFEKGQYARFQNEILSAAKTKLGLEDTDLADLTEEEKKSIQKMVVKIAEKHLGKKGSVQGAKDLQEQVSKLTGDLEKKDVDWQAKLDNELQAKEGKAGARIIKAETKSLLSSLDGVELTVPASYITDQLLAKITAKYLVVLDANDEPQLKQKENPALDVMEGGKKVSFADMLKKQVIEDKVGKAKEVEKPGERKRVTVGAGEGGEESGVELASYITDKIAANQKLEG